MIIDIITDAIKQNVGSLKAAPKGWYKRHCPLCHTRGHGKDTRNRLGLQFNPNSIAVNCFNCGFSASFTEGKSLSSSFIFFLSQINIDRKLIDYIEFEIFKEKNQIVSLRDGDEVKETTENKLKKLFTKWQPMDLPKGSAPIMELLEDGVDDPNFLNVVNYAIDRGFIELEKFYWSPDTYNNLNQRLLIPYFYKSKIVGFTSRLCYDTEEKLIPKYFQQCPQDFVYNLDNQSAWSRKYTIVTEGVFDAFVVDGISILGEIGQSKIDVVNRLQKEIIVCPDRDKKGKDLVDAAIENNWAVSFPKWDRSIKDAAKASEKYGRLLTTQSIISSAISGKDKIQVKWKIEHNDRQRQFK